LYLAEVYLIFVRKSYKQNQIFHYFDRHSSGKITPEELIQSLAELGIAPEEDFIKKIINYLDRSR
jgi:Ca2+-binding EF-hand superfamily protein